MPLPSLIEIVPLDPPVQAEVTVPGSKSITNRALILAALAEGETVLRGALWSEDTQVMVECLQALGFMINVEPDPAEPGNRVLTVYGKGGVIPPGGTAQAPLTLQVGNAGTAARFLAAFLCLGRGCYRLEGVPRMHERPQAGLFDALRQLGYRVESPNQRLPAVIHGGGARSAACRVSIGESSQFASALLLCAAAGQWRVEVTGQNAEESPYVVLTTRLIEAFPKSGGRFQVEPDASSGSYFWGAAWLSARARVSSAGPSSRIGVRHWPATGWQVDERFPRFFPPDGQTPVGRISRLSDLGDSIMTGIVLAPWADRPVEFTDLGRLRLQECERVHALRTELERCGARIVEEGDTLRVWPGPLHGAEIQTYNDHRMAMCFGMLGLALPGVRIHNPSCVRKTFPGFFQKLAAPPPLGLGAGILDARDGRRLGVEDLQAE
jgi:3-phosphoshikimate 1-carboxyvinyltransferase